MTDNRPLQSRKDDTLSDTDDARKAILAIVQKHDVGIAVAALAQVLRLVYANVDKHRPDLSEHIRDDFNRHLTGTKKAVN